MSRLMKVLLVVYVALWVYVCWIAFTWVKAIIAGPLP